MRAGSLRLRLLAGTLAWMLLAIALVGWGLRTLFQDHIAQQLQAQLVMQLDHLSASVDWSAPDSVSVSPMAADPRLAQPLSGLYWQIDRLGAAPQAGVARSRSLWDQVLRLPDAPRSYPASRPRAISSMWVKRCSGSASRAVSPATTSRSSGASSSGSCRVRATASKAWPCASCRGSTLNPLAG